MKLGIHENMSKRILFSCLLTCCILEVRPETRSKRLLLENQSGKETGGAMKVGPALL